MLLQCYISKILSEFGELHAQGFKRIRVYGVLIQLQSRMLFDIDFWVE